MGLPASQQGALKRAYAADIATTCSLTSADSVWDLSGRNGTVSITTDDTIEAFVAVPQDSTANALARKLYASAFKQQLVHTTSEKLGVVHMLTVGTVVLEL